MDSQASTRHNVDLLERMLLDRDAEPTYVPLSLLEDITNCFSDDRQIGSGGFAVVYKGVVGKGMVAVKKLFQTLDMHENKFHKEVECLMKAKHKNIVRFLGYCSDTQGRIADYEGKFVMADLRNWLLCFEYVPNGSLDKHITDASSGLKWRERYQIIKGIFAGLLHLHEKRIVHLDLKPGKILIDDHLVPKIADFGVSRCLDKEQTRDFTAHLCGSPGYLAPEFYRGEVAFASDIYSLGVIIMEILTGKKSWMSRFEGSDQWDTQLEQVRVCTKIGIECLDMDPKKRPVARHIGDMLEKTSITIVTGINNSSVEQEATFLKEQHYQEKITLLLSEYLGKDITEQTRTENVTEYVCTLEDERWQQGQEEALKQNVIPQGASISSSNSVVLSKLNNLHATEARRNYLGYGGCMLEKKPKLKLYKQEELKPILKDTNFVRKDDFVEVYKGLVDNVLITVKKLLIPTTVLEKKFAKEVVIQSHIIHKNIVRLIGCCVEVDHPMLVHELPSKGSLHDILHSNHMVPLSLGVRLSIAAASTGALAYMHSLTSLRSLHSNFKTANILFDDNFVPVISDFDISRMVRKFKHSGIVVGDMAYTDPVYLQTGRLTEQSDAYSFGVVILELLTREKAIDSADNSLVKAFLENHEKGRKSTELFDKEIAVPGDLELLETLAGIAVECLNHSVVQRPRMIEVADRLVTLNRARKLTVRQTNEFTS